MYVCVYIYMYIYMCTSYGIADLYGMSSIIFDTNNIHIYIHICLAICVFIGVLLN